MGGVQDYPGRVKFVTLPCGRPSRNRADVAFACVLSRLGQFMQGK
jgi:hypothetical protein